jgi:ABC-2 type transport system permease protein
MLRIYQRLWQVNWSEQWQYRANLIMYLLFWIVSPVVYLAVWTTVANAQGSVQGLAANDFVVYYMTLLVVDQLTSEVTIHYFGYKVQDGSLSNELIRPIHPILTNTLVSNLAFKVLILGGLLPVWVALWFLYRPDFSMVTLSNVALAAPAIVLGFALNFLLGAALTCLAFWTTRVWSLAEFYWAIVSLFSGQFVPLTLMPAAVQSVAAYLPFQMFKYFPIQIILGRLTPDEIVRGYVSGAVWLVIAGVMFAWVWREGVKKYSAVGA